MNVMMNLLVGVQMLAALAMIGLILLQHGKGADMGAAFGSGSAGSLFGASGSANFLSRTTAALAVVFFGCTLGLAYLGHSRPAGGDSLLERAATQAPAAPAAAPVAPASEIPAGASQKPAAAPSTGAAAGQPAGAKAPASGSADQIPNK
ncbi:preprotein translocase subunit SecG [Variovorax dokdonensis]|uniref:Protein-export membrane protein SecG n=1 Tax=Variovorax dokdonensis TaxID=344883 RepID=A0ABT7NF30_9BURK|nr:preprotein translocase subunit SecG [Variovorax dokdonensis]MDM0046430.1 preprotein translocase subunit SecG [Variovorax dokdonensis]